MAILLPWERKAHDIIARLCYASYRQTNTKKDGTMYKKKRPYSVPKLAADLVECLGAEDEERAKAIFLSYDGIQAGRLNQ